MVGGHRCLCFSLRARLLQTQVHQPFSADWLVLRADWLTAMVSASWCHISCFHITKRSVYLECLAGTVRLCFLIISYISGIAVFEGFFYSTSRVPVIRFTRAAFFLFLGSRWNGYFISLYLVVWFLLYTIYPYSFLLLDLTTSRSFNLFQPMSYAFDVLFLFSLLTTVTTLTIPCYAKRTTNPLTFLPYWELLLRSKKPTQLSCFNDFIFSSLFIFYDEFWLDEAGGLEEKWRIWMPQEGLGIGNGKDRLGRIMATWVRD